MSTLRKQGDDRSALPEAPRLSPICVAHVHELG